MSGGYFHDLGNLLGRLGKEDGIGKILLHVSIIGIGQEVLLRGFTPSR
jgi:hypothetical protein